MKEFLRSTLATIAGIFICGFIFAILGITTMAGLLATSATETVVKDKSVFTLDLQGVVDERYQPSPIDQFLDDNMSMTMGLDDILASIRKAEKDKHIKGIYLNSGALVCSSASLQEIRNALADFKKSGKFLIAYSDAYTQGGYYLASVADKVIVNPAGSLSWHGLAAESMFYKDLLDKIGVKMQVFRVGTYKSAVEPYIGTEMSPANRKQTQAFIHSIWNEMLEDVAESRNVSKDSLNALADRNMDFQPAQTYIENGLADTLMYKDEVLAYLKSLTETEEDDELRTLTLEDMINVSSQKPKNKSGNIIAVYYATGDIDNGSSYDEGINSEKVCKDLRDLRKDEHVKAVVLRVNSPGGSAYGSEQIWREVSLLKAEKPVVVSMGDYAASGGYYISCAATKIVAEPTTLTGSIGILGLVPDISQLMTDKLGLRIDGVKTNKLSDLGSMGRPLNEEEGALIQHMVNNGYELFTKRCADGRGMSVDSIKSIAEGRVWTGSMAKELNLVDQLGGLDTAISLAKELSGTDEYNLICYPEKEDFFTSLISTGKGRYIKSQLKQACGELYNELLLLKNINKADRLQARMPFELHIR